MLYPRLRALDIRLHRQGGQHYFLLRDPLQLSEQMLLVPAPHSGEREPLCGSQAQASLAPAPLGPAPALCDGTHDVAAMRSLLVGRFGAHFENGIVDELLTALARIQNAHNVCGLAPTYLALQLLGATEGERVGYDSCPADEDNTSVVTVTGIVFE